MNRIAVYEPLFAASLFLSRSQSNRRGAASADFIADGTREGEQQKWEQANGREKVTDRKDEKESGTEREKGRKKQTSEKGKVKNGR